MSTLVLNREQFPDAVPPGAVVGDKLTFRLTGTVRRIEADLVDVQSLGSRPEYLLGSTDVELQLTAIEREEE